MIEIQNKDLFGKVIADALVKIDSNPGLQAYERMRWFNAVAKAVVQIEDHGAFMDFDADKQTLLIWSDKSNNIYEANGVCQCKAFELGQPCWHKAAKQIIKNYLAALMPPQVKGAAASPATPAASDIAKTPYFQTTLSAPAAPVKIGNIRI